jgi:hypothetical protein
MNWLKWLYNWLRLKSRREVLTFIGSGIAALAVAAWAVATHEAAKSEGTTSTSTVTTAAPSIAVSPTVSPTISPTINTTVSPTIENKPTVVVTPPTEPQLQVQVDYNLCVGEYERSCPIHNAYGYCGTNVSAWAAGKCGELLSSVQVQSYGGNKCGYAIYHVTCTARE